MPQLEALCFRVPRGLLSKVRLLIYQAFGMTQGVGNRMEGKGRVRRCKQIIIGDYNAFTEGCWLWPDDSDHDGARIRIGNSNYFNRNVMIDACGFVEIGNRNMIGPDVYITDSDHRFGPGLVPGAQPMERGEVFIGNRCWIGAKTVILKGARLEDGCVVAAGAVVNRTVEAGQVVGGVPARPIGRSRRD
jgi:acetyltransferase-like isoleucine patch superfamily enzyme